MNAGPESSVGTRPGRKVAREPEPLMPTENPHSQGILTARPSGNPARMPAAGVRPLGAGGGRDGLLRIPRVIASDRPVPLLVMLHGARGSAASAMSIVADAAEAHGVIILAPDSRSGTWDVIREDYGEDVAFIDRALGEVFRTCRIDPARIALAGFSDGASYALSLGLHKRRSVPRHHRVLARLRAAGAKRGRAVDLHQHGREDPVLPIERCGRRIAVRLRSLGYAVDYQEFAAATSSPRRWSRRRFAASWPERRQ